MKLSIITINYNNAEGLRKTLASVAAQTYANIEHIIVDGGSTDGSVEIIREYADNQAKGERLKAKGVNECKVESVKCKGEENSKADTNASTPYTLHPTQTETSTLYTLHLTPSAHIVRWISEPDKGIYNAMNKGLEIALGKRVVNDDHTSSPNSPIASSPDRLSDYIQILNSGDILAADDVTDRMMAALKENVKQQHQQQNTNNHSVMEQHTITANENNTLSPNRLIASSPLENCPAIFYGNMIKEYPDGRRVVDRCQAKDYTPESFYYFYRGTLNHDCAYIRRDLFEKYGLYNEQMKICSDWEWYVRAIVLGGEKTVYTNIDVTVFDMTGISESDGKNRELIQKERREYLESILPAAVLRDYDMYSLPIEQYRRLKKHHLWGIIYFVERVLFKFEKWSK